MTPPTIIPSLRQRVLQIARDTGYALSPDDVVRGTGCTADAARIVLADLARDGQLFAIATGWYAVERPVEKPLKRNGNPHVFAGRSERKSKAVELAEVERWLRDCPPLPKCRPNFNPQRRGAP